MKSYLVSRQIELTEMECKTCGILYALPEAVRAERKSSGAVWYCPNGHQWWYKESEADRYRNLYEQERQRAANWRDEYQVERAAHSTTKGQMTKLKNRVANGVCPVCHRTFVALGRHMHTKHPDYGLSQP